MRKVPEEGMLRESVRTCRTKQSKGDQLVSCQKKVQVLLTLAQCVKWSFERRKGCDPDEEALRRWRGR
jgi:hypothetical protein